MNLLCPNCQKMLTVAEEFSGQLMKCPLCEGTFTVPALPAAGEPAEVPAGAASHSAGGAEVYGLQEPPAEPPSNGALSRGPVPPGDRTLDLPSSSPDAEETSSRITAEPSEAADKLAPTPRAGEHSVYIPLSMDVLRWVAPGALLLIFIFQMFPWVGLYPGGYEVATQNAWGAAFGSQPEDNGLQEWGWPSDEGELGMSLVTLFYLIPCFFLVFAVTVACAVAELLADKLPQVLWPIYPWRWAIALGANVFLLLILLMQLAVGFELESRMATAAERMYPAREKPALQQQVEVQRGIFEERVQRTFWLRLVVLLHLVAIAGCGLTYWLTWREPDRPTPGLAFYW
jgi:hypothetical protein